MSGARAFVDHSAVAVHFIFGDCTRNAIATGLKLDSSSLGATVCWFSKSVNSVGLCSNVDSIVLV